MGLDAGAVVDGTDLIVLSEKVDGMIAPDTVDWSADLATSVVGSVSNPNLGSSTISALYWLEHEDAEWYEFSLIVTINTGGAWNVGSGVWTWPLPFDANGVRHCGTGYIFESGVANRAATLRVAAAEDGFEIYADGATSAIASTGIFSGGGWTTGDIIDVFGRIRRTV